MTAIQKKIVIDEHGEPQEVIISWAQFLSGMPKLVVHKRAARYLQRMDARIKAQLVAKLGELAQNPDASALVLISSETILHA